MSETSEPRDQAVERDHPYLRLLVRPGLQDELALCHFVSWFGGPEKIAEPVPIRDKIGRATDFYL